MLEKTPGLPGSGGVCRTPVPVDSEIREDHNFAMNRKTFSLRTPSKLISSVLRAVISFDVLHRLYMIF